MYECNEFQSAKKEEKDSTLAFMLCTDMQQTTALATTTTVLN